MKKILIILIVTLTTIKTYGQVSSIGMRQEFKSITGYGSRQSGFEGLQTYNTGNVSGNQFFTENWATGSLTTAGKEVLTDYVFLYDKVRQELFLKQKDSDLVVLAYKDQILSFTINSDKPHVFYHAEIYDPGQKGNFFEVIVQNENYTLLKLTKTTFEKAKPNDMEKVKQGIFNDEFIDHITYYVYHNNKIEKVGLNEHSLYKVFKDKKNTVDDFFTNNQNNEINEQLLANLINYVN